MKMNWKIFVAFVVLGWLNSAKAEKPNILFIYLDDFGWRDAGFMGSDFYETPNLDRLAREGMVFTDAYSGASNCAPARACLLSGQYTPRHKVYNVGTKPRGKAAFRRIKHVPGTRTLDPKIKTWAEQLRQSGYRTATMGKWHLSEDPIPYGFEINIGGSHSGGPPQGYYPPHGNAPGLSGAPKEEYLTDRLSAEAVKFIQTNKNQAWCLYLTHFAVHTPLNAKKALLEKYRTKPKGKLHNHVAMATMIEAVDQGVGLIVKQLEELHLSDRTVIFFYSDNGGYGPATDMAPLKGYKGTYYEGGIRVPFFAHWPGKIQPGSKSSEPITGVDFYPTICELGKTGLPKNQVVDGVSLVSLMTGRVDRLNPRAIYWHFPAYLQSYNNRSGDYSEQRDPLFRSRPCSIIRKANWKLHQYFERNELELYDLDNDIGETKNLAEVNPDKTMEMLGALQAWQKSIAAPTKFEPNELFNETAEAEAIRKRQRK